MICACYIVQCYHVNTSIHFSIGEVSLVFFQQAPLSILNGDVQLQLRCSWQMLSNASMLMLAYLGCVLQHNIAFFVP